MQSPIPSVKKSMSHLEQSKRSCCPTVPQTAAGFSGTTSNQSNSLINFDFTASTVAVPPAAFAGNNTFNLYQAVGAVASSVLLNINVDVNAAVNSGVTPTINPVAVVGFLIEDEKGYTVICQPTDPGASTVVLPPIALVRWQTVFSRPRMSAAFRSCCHNPGCVCLAHSTSCSVRRARGHKSRSAAITYRSKNRVRPTVAADLR